MVTRLISANSSDLLKMNGEELKQVKVEPFLVKM